MTDPLCWRIVFRLALKTILWRTEDQRNGWRTAGTGRAGNGLREGRGPPRATPARDVARNRPGNGRAARREGPRPPTVTDWRTATARPPAGSSWPRTPARP